KRGGGVDGVYVRNIKVGKVKEAVLKINMHYSVYGNQTGNFIPEVRNVFLENITVKNAGEYAVFADGLENSNIDNVILKNVRIDTVKKAFNLKHITNLKVIDTYINKEMITNLN